MSKHNPFIQTALVALSLGLLAGCGTNVTAPKAPAAQAPQAAAYKTVAQGTTFTSWGDPHEVSGDGCAYENQNAGVFTKLKATLSHDLELQVRQGVYSNGIRCNTGMALVANKGGDVIRFYPRVNELYVAGKLVVPGIQDATYALPHGGQLAVAGNVGTVTTPRGDVINFTAQSPTYSAILARNWYYYVDITGTLSANRGAGDIRGELGTFDHDANANDDLRWRDGVHTSVCQEYPTAFELSWLLPDGGLVGNVDPQ